MKEYNTKSELSTIPQLKIPNIILQYAKESLSTSILLLEHQDGTITKVVGKKRGNATYNFHMSAKMNLINDIASENLKVDLKEKSSNTIFLTLTTHYIPGDIDSSLQAIENVKKRLPVFLKNVKNNIGDFSYLWCMECHKNGGCHIHIVLQFFKKMFSFFRDKLEKFRNDFLNSLMKKLWKIGNIDLQGVLNDNGIFNYITKEIGKSQNTENSILRYEKKEELKKNDTNKIWLLGLSFLYKKLYNKNIRFLGMSKDFSISEEKIKEEKMRMITEYQEEIQANALINNMNKSEKDLEEKMEILENYKNINENKIIRYVMVGKNYAKHNLKYFYKSGKVKNQIDYEQCKKILDEYSIKTFTDKVEFKFNKKTTYQNDNKITA